MEKAEEICMGKAIFKSICAESHSDELRCQKGLELVNSEGAHACWADLSIEVVANNPSFPDIKNIWHVNNSMKGDRILVSAL